VQEVGYWPPGEAYVIDDTDFFATIRFAGPRPVDWLARALW
jgi:hypothetical protein